MRKTYNLEQGHVAKLEAIQLKGNFRSQSAALRWLLNKAYQNHLEKKVVA